MRAVRLVVPAALALLAAAASPTGAAQTRTETAFPLVRLDPSTRAAALAGAGALAGDDPTAAFYNPALLGPDMDRAGALSYANHPADVNAGTAAYARTLGLGGLTASAAVRFLSYGDFERRATLEGEADGSFSAGEAAVTVSAARAVLPQVRVGASVHALFASVEDASASALAADLGAAVEVPSQQLTLGASVHHVGAVLSSLGGVEDRLPLDVRLTVAKGLQYVPLTVSVAAVDLQAFEGPETDSSLVRRALDHLALGGELRLGSTLTARAGYRPRAGDDLRTSDERLSLAGVSLGAGLRLRRVTVDYAYLGRGGFGAVHQFGVRTRL
jgi:hypothetical protein